MLATTRLASPTLSNQMSRAPPSDAHALPVRHAERSPPRPSPALQLAHRHAQPGLAGRLRLYALATGAAGTCMWLLRLKWYAPLRYLPPGTGQIR